MDAIFGALYRDPGRAASHEEWEGIARLLGNPSPIIQSEPGIALSVNRGALRGEAETTFAISADGSIWAAVLGRIERGALTREVASAGLDAGNCTNAEIVIELFRFHGTEFIQRVQGFFAIVLWDSNERRLLLYADRCAGLRTLYYYDGPHAFRFGSSIRALLAQPGIPREVNRLALEDFLILAHPVPPDTLVSGVRTIPAGCFLEVVPRQTPRLKRYWQHRPYRYTTEDLAALDERYFDALCAAVRSSRSSAVLLSGGVDSATIVSLLRRQGGTRVSTYTLASDDEDASDRDTARVVADLFETDHHVIELDESRSLDALPETVWHYESAGDHLHPFYCLSRAASGGNDVVLGGHGNDVIWGSRRALGRTPPPLVSRGAQYLAQRRRMSRNNLKQLMPGALPDDLELEERISRVVPQLDDPREDLLGLNEALFGDQRVFGEIGKTAVDAHSLWVDTPFSDSAVLAAAESVPLSARAKRHATGTIELKSFFKNLTIARGILPAEIVNRRKTWLRSPVDRWLRGDLGETIEALLLQGQARERNLFDMGEVRRLLDEHRSGTGQHGSLLMKLASVELWHRLFIDPPLLRPPSGSLRGYAEAR